MSDIRITSAAQGVIALGAVTAVGLALAAQYPEIKRYLKIRSM